MSTSADPAGTHLPAAEDPLALERQVCFALVVAARSVLSVYRPVLEPMGLTHPQYLVMLALWGREPMSVRELSEALQLDAPTLSPLLKRLEAAGLLERRRLPEDQRSLAVSLTGAGRALRARAERVPAQVVERLGVDVHELEALRDGLSRVIAAARTAAEPQDDPQVRAG
ncbi:MarR family winged helix-turn-helix transcriptional regulator [Kineococcus gypseus]|uniref:MarR family winged helix-turn-helix transcriptional regulator n=1 Tax=Kineococcus gypseus TaxID=1637102 RepID=UPI003D7C94F8